VSFLLDTNVISEWVKPQPEPNVVSWLAEADEDRVFVSVISFAEIRRGIGLMATGRRRERLGQWLDAIRGPHPCYRYASRRNRGRGYGAEPKSGPDARIDGRFCRRYRHGT
jgi:hypothetical protein